jgi:WD40 repeat protein
LRGAANAAVVLAALVACRAGGQAPDAVPPEAPGALLYRAATAAAEASLRLHETAAARRWLDEAPPEHRGWEWRYLRARSDESAFAAEAHAGPINGVDVAPDGRLVATAGRDGRVRLWTARGAPVRDFLGHTAPVWTARFSPDGRRLVSASSDGTARVWDVESGMQALRLEGIGAGIAAAAFRPDGSRIAVSSWLRSRERGVWGVVTLWDAATGAKLRTLEHGVKPIVALAWSPDGSRLAAGTWDDDVAVWDAASWGEPARFVPPPGGPYAAVQAVAWSADGRRLAVGAKDGHARVWDVPERKLLSTATGQAEGQTQWVNGVAFHAEDLLAAQADGTLRVFAPDGRERVVLHGHAGPVAALAIGRGGFAYTVGGDGMLRGWDLVARAPERSVWRPGQSVYELAFSPDGRRAAVTGWTGIVQVWDVLNGTLLRSVVGHEQSGVRVVWSPDGRFLATTGNDGKIVLWDAETLARRVDLAHVPDTQIAGVAFSPDGRLVAAPTTPGAVGVWDTGTGEPRATLQDGERAIWHLAWSPDGRSLAVGGRDGVVALWDWRSRAVTRRLEQARGSLFVDFHPDGRTLLAASSDRTISLWDVASGRRLRVLRGHGGAVHGARFSPDGGRIASAGEDGLAKLWDPASGRELLSVPAEAVVYSVAWSPDGERLALLPLDGSVRILHAPASR